MTHKNDPILAQRADARRLISATIMGSIIDGIALVSNAVEDIWMLINDASGVRRVAFVIAVLLLCSITLHLYIIVTQNVYLTTLVAASIVYSKNFESVKSFVRTAMQSKHTQKETKDEISI